MSEYMEKFAISFSGSASRIQGYEEGGQLTESTQKTILCCIR
jgi:ATP-dependent Clp protease ATP-binding subunit ClpA